MSPMTERAKFRDAVKDHGPYDPALRYLLMLLVDFTPQDDGSRWATISILVGQFGRGEKTVSQRLKQLDGTWFRRWKQGRKWHYLLIDPGPGAVIPTVTEVRKHRNHRTAIEGGDTGTTVPEHRNDRTQNTANTGTTVPPRLIETSIDYGQDGRPLPEEATEPPAPAAGTVRCPKCKADHVEGRECGRCLREQLLAQLHNEPDTATGGQG